MPIFTWTFRSNDDSFKSIIRISNWPINRDKCYVKVLVIGRRSVFKVESHNADQNGRLFGNSTDITRPTRDNSSLSAACLEYRCADSSENTYIVVTPTSGGCRFCQSASGLWPNGRCGLSTRPPLQGEARVICDDQSFYHNRIDGLYKPKQGSFGAVWGSCLSGRGSGSKTHMSSAGYALYYDCRYWSIDKKDGEPQTMIPFASLSSFERINSG